MCAHVPSSDNTAIEEGMRLMRQCPRCQQEYAFDNIDLIEADTGAHLVHITCATCTSSMLAIIMVTGFGMSSVGMITDLHAIDVRRLQQTPPLTADDILGLYEALHTRYAVERSLVQQ
jgi:hypothetical protein